jgi:hypothetical protein
MSRLPTPGADDNIWGNLLNDYLSVEHNTDGSLKKSSAITQAQADAAQALSTANTAQSAVAGKLDASQKGAVNGVASLDGNGKLAQFIDAGNMNSGTLDVARIPDLSTLYLAIGAGLTLDSADGSGQQWKLIAMQDGSVRAVPQNVTAPAAPTGLAGDIHLTFVKLTWQTVAGAVSYRVYRDGSLLSTPGGLTYVDATVQVNTTYSYTVVAVNQYSMWSQPSSAFSATISTNLNSAPSFGDITVWPLNPRPNDKVYVRVNARDVDTQQLAMTLGVDAGTLTTTFDPSTWIWEGV